MLSALVDAALINQIFIAMIQRGKQQNLLGIPVVPASYANSIIPAIVAIWALSYIEHFFDRYL
ncbi:hypothetical protein GYM70_00090 [Lactobacillus panisapium]|uniref:hypothetical protein n=1 Tax=Lactobacillus panisapium TaxID=2012495 RepID=UPI001C69B0F2|nr:hypothetical protein [Lactobacillus panisapium]QYN53893.1 hypothetical protein GYM70_00090 [Lactobacillus panisapium]